tara:strand:+ start:358 stop:597 length:240 start_codon:yes stop_codon:yes gene_type:complete
MKQQLNSEIFRLNEINYREMMINHMVFAIENQTTYKQLMIDGGGLDFDSKSLLMTEIKRNNLLSLMYELISDYYQGGSK